jgi:hypothetical protein
LSSSAEYDVALWAQQAIRHLVIGAVQMAESVTELHFLLISTPYYYILRLRTMYLLALLQFRATRELPASSVTWLSRNVAFYRVSEAALAPGGEFTVEPGPKMTSS